MSHESSEEASPDTWREQMASGSSGTFRHSITDPRLLQTSSSPLLYALPQLQNAQQHSMIETLEPIWDGEDTICYFLSADGAPLSQTFQPFEASSTIPCYASESSLAPAFATLHSQPLKAAAPEGLYGPIKDVQQTALLEAMAVQSPAPATAANEISESSQPQRAAPSQGLTEGVLFAKISERQLAETSSFARQSDSGISFHRVAVRPPSAAPCAVETPQAGSVDDPEAATGCALP